VKHLLVVPDEILLPLPFGVLVTRTDAEAYQSLAELYAKQLSPAPEELAAYAKLSWLAKEYAITVLPSATSLRALRRIAHAKGTVVEPFIGFGDPLLRGGGRKRGGAMLAARGVGVPVEELRRLNRLPGTREELKAVATALGADPTKALYLGSQATKPVVRQLNTTGRLGQAQVLSFATHGLLAGELKGLSQPALVLTPPATPSEEDDGLLALEDILGLKLPSTDWVILSACNTAAGDGSGEGLAGLARAFFFAGARSLLVSHWSVEDRATEALMTEVFRRHAHDKAMPRAEALRQGMLALMAQAQGPTAYFAHPFAWAPFFLVGDGGAEKK
jgi:CHAT domain-containing protein